VNIFGKHLGTQDELFYGQNLVSCSDYITSFYRTLLADTMLDFTPIRIFKKNMHDNQQKMLRSSAMPLTSKGCDTNVTVRYLSVKISLCTKALHVT